MFKILNIFCVGDWELILHLELGFAFPPKFKEVKKDGLKIIY
jgi:hypothetical protein